MSTCAIVEGPFSSSHFFFLYFFNMWSDSYEARILQKWSRSCIGYFLGIHTPGVLLHAYHKRTQIFQKKKKSFSFNFSFGYVTKIDKSNESRGNMNFRCNYIDVHLFYLLFWVLICNLKTI